MLCVGKYWSEEQAKDKMKEFGEQWNDLKGWEARRAVIRK
jgi:hypothetical protein